jgi:hypothetical protein
MERREPVIEVVDDAMVEVLRRMTGWQRLRIVDGLFETAWQLVEGNVRADHPDWDERRIRWAVAERIAGQSRPERYFQKFNQARSREIEVTGAPHSGHLPVVFPRVSSPQAVQQPCHLLRSEAWRREAAAIRYAMPRTAAASILADPTYTRQCISTATKKLTQIKAMSAKPICRGPTPGRAKTGDRVVSSRETHRTSLTLPAAPES